MHELAVTENILEIATRHATQAQAKRVTDIYLVIGSLSSIIDDSVQFYWDIISKNTICYGAQLHFHRIPAQMTCQECGHLFSLENNLLTPCPQCSSANIRVISGEQFYLDSIEIEK